VGAGVSAVSAVASMSVHLSAYGARWSALFGVGAPDSVRALPMISAICASSALTLRSERLLASDLSAGSTQAGMKRRKEAHRE